MAQYIKKLWHAGGERYERVYDTFFFVKNPVNEVIRKISPLKTANLTKNRRSHCIHCSKIRVLCGENVFSPLFTAILLLLSTKPGPGESQS